MAHFLGWTSKKKSKKTNKQTQVSECSVPSFRIDLQCKPMQRWTHIVRAYQQDIKRLIESILSLEQYQISDDDEEQLNEIVSNSDSKHRKQQNGKNVSQQKTSFYESLTQGIFERLQRLGGADYVQEMEGIAKLFAKDGFTVQHILLTHLLYESFCGCTAMTAVDDDNALILGRTLDWIDFEDQLLRRLTIDVEVYNGTRLVYKYTTFAGYIGVLTALKVDCFSFAINFREFSTHEATDEITSSDSWPVGFLGRFVCDACDNYESAVKMWSTAPLMAPAYIVVAGKQHSTQLTRDEAANIQPCVMAVMQSRKEEKECKHDDHDNDDIDHEAQSQTQLLPYILQANIDHWSHQYHEQDEKKKKGHSKHGKHRKAKKPRKANGDIDHDTMDSIRRLNVAQKCLRECRGKLNQTQMWQLLYTQPIHERDWTIYSTVMNVSTGYYKSKRHLY